MKKKFLYSICAFIIYGILNNSLVAKDNNADIDSINSSEDDFSIQFIPDDNKNLNTYSQKKSQEHSLIFFHDKYQHKLAKNIAHCSSKLIESHYDGIRSFKIGSKYLRDLQLILQSSTTGINSQKLELLFTNCNGDLSHFKTQLKRKKISRNKDFTEHHKIELSNYLYQLFPDNYHMIDFIEKAYTSEIDCLSSKGGTIGLAAGLGGYGGAYKRLCRSPLGRSFEIIKLHAGINAGMGGALNSSLFGDVKNKNSRKVKNHTRSNQLAFDHHGAAVLGVGVGENVTIPSSELKKICTKPKNSKPKVSATASPALGLGIFFGLFGLSAEHKRELTPDFFNLFSIIFESQINNHEEY